MRSFNPNLYPPNGYVFTERDGTLLRGDGWKDLERRVRGYRAVNKIDPGDPWEEIQNQVCATSPHCREDGPPAPAAERAHSMTLNQRVVEWVVLMVGRKRAKKLELASDKVAAARAAICARCPKQKGLNRVCEACNKSIRDGEKALLGEKSGHRNLTPCGVLGEDCAISVHLNQPAAADPALPAKCWRRADG